MNFSNKKTLWAGIVAAVLVVGGLTYYFTKSKGLPKPPDVAFAEYVYASTSGTISAASPIRVILTADVTDSVEREKLLEEDLFDFSPNIKGKMSWQGVNTLVFQPDEALPSGEEYTGTFKLSKVVEVENSDLEKFPLSFRVIPQDFEVAHANMRYPDNRNMRQLQLSGKLFTADKAPEKAVEQILTAKQNDKDLKITWYHNPDGTNHIYTVEGVAREDNEGSVQIAWNGKSIEVDKKGEETVVIPALGDFIFMNHEVSREGEQYVSLFFSNPLSETQDLTGLVALQDGGQIRYLSMDNELRVYPENRLSGVKSVVISEAVKNILEIPLSVSQTVNVDFEEGKPTIEILGNGVILPTKGEIVFPFRAVNLKTVKVRVVKIFEHNVHQFLQVNTLTGEQELRRVGRPILEKRINLKATGFANLEHWNQFNLDLTPYLKTEPGAIYQVELSFTKQDILNSCPGDDNEVSSNIFEDGLAYFLPEQESDPEFDNTNEYYYDDYEYGEYYEDYDWQERHNPCNAAFYRQNTTRKYKNILVSNIGLIAKAGVGGRMYFFANNLLTTEPMKDVELEIYDFQKQSIVKVVTDGEGKAEIVVKQKPFLLVAHQGTQRGYLKLDDGSSLSLSAFDVNGEMIQRGLKGFIYGERGVWRPGDSLFLTFILNDQANPLPKGHPVILELLNPQDQVFKRIASSKGLNGFYAFKVTTPQDAPTGNWTARVTVGNVQFTKRLKIEAIKPNRLKIDLRTDKAYIDAASLPMNAKLSVKWLHGATAANLRAEYKLSFSSTTTSFDAFPKYTFDNPTKNLDVPEETVFDSKLDENGNAVIPLNFNLKESAAGKVLAQFKGRVYEEGGEFSSDYTTIPVFPFTSFVGIEVPQDDPNKPLETDRDNQINLVCVNAQGQLKSANVEVTLYKLDWRWWWENSNDDLSNYMSSSYMSNIGQKTVSLAGGKGIYEFKIDKEKWGRYMIIARDPVSGHSTGKIVYIDWPSSYGRANRGDAASATMLSFSTEKSRYNVGEKVKLQIPSSKGGRALVSIENGSKVVKSFWVSTSDGSTDCSFEAEASMTPNIFAHVTLLQPHANTVNDLPIRMYGVVPIIIENAASHLNPILETAATFEPDKDYTLSVSEKEGKAMTYSIALVDDGLLDLTKFKTPDPWSTFYAREALGVKSWDLYDYVCGAYGASLDKLLAIGGDGEVKNKGGLKATRFKPMVRYIGPFYLGKGGKAQHKIHIPNYVGSVRAMIVAGQDAAYGSVEKTIPVKKALMVLATLPRVLGPNEEIVLPVTIFTSEAGIRNVSISIKTNNKVQLIGSTTQQCYFKTPGEKVVYFKLKAKAELGIAKVEVSATGGKINSKYSVELDVRNPNPVSTQIKDYVVRAGESLSQSASTIGMAGSNEISLEFSNIAPINLGSRLNYLIAYPHGCIEQTTSSVYPQLYLKKLMTLTPAQQAETERNIKAGIEKLSSFQTPDGGFSYWPGGLTSDEWGSSYAGVFLTEASRMGYAVPSSMLKKWRKYQSKMAQSFAARSDQRYFNTVQAYRLYTLALAGSAELGAMNRLREQSKVENEARWLLAAAYVHAGQPEVGKRIAYSCSTTPNNYVDSYYTYGSGDRDQALMLEVLTLLGNETAALPLYTATAKSLGSSQWMNTQSTAYCLMSVSRFVEKFGKGEAMMFNYTWNGSAEKNVKGTVGVFSEKQAVKNGANKFTVKNNGKGSMFVRVIMRGQPLVDNQTAQNQNISMEVIYKNAAGVPIDISSLTQGTEFFAEVKISNPGTRGDLQRLALVQNIPSGWEIINQRMEAEGTNAASSDYQDIRDDRVNTYFDLNANQAKIIRIRLHASYAGQYMLPAIRCEAMYDNDIYCQQPGMAVRVLEKK